MSKDKSIESKLAKFRKSDKPKQFTSWGFTRYNDYKQCPLKAKLKHLDKIEEPASEPMQRGIAVGEATEAYVKGQIKKMPMELAKFRDIFNFVRDAFKKHPDRMVVEETWGFTKEWSATPYDNWAKCAVRIKIDCGYYDGEGKDPFVRMTIRDWKTGKFKTDKVEEYTQQLELYALGAFMMNPKLKNVEAFLVFLDLGVIYPEPNTPEAKRLTFTRADVPRLKKLWDGRVRAMLLDTSFKARPNRGCTWCHYRKANAAAMPGGKALCQY